MRRPRGEDPDRRYPPWPFTGEREGDVRRGMTGDVRRGMTGDVCRGHLPEKASRLEVSAVAIYRKRHPDRRCPP